MLKFMMNIFDEKPFFLIQVQFDYPAYYYYLTIITTILLLPIYNEFPLPI